MEKAIAFCTVNDDIAYYLAERARKSFCHFNDDVPCEIITPFDELEIFGEAVKPVFGSSFANLSVKMISHYKKDYEVVIKLDADVVVTSRLDEFLDCDYDIACSLNCPNVGGIDYKRFPDYCNLGVTAVRSKELAEEWKDLTYDKKFIGEQGFDYLEQDVMNYLAHSGKYKCLIVDKEGCYYNETGREHWDKIKIKHQGLFIGERKLKAMHWAGGGELSNKYNWPALPADVKKFLNKITRTEDFV